MMMTRRITALAVCLAFAACVGEKNNRSPADGSADPSAAKKADEVKASSTPKPEPKPVEAPKPAPEPKPAPVPLPDETLPKAPDKYKVEFDTTVGAFTVEVTRDWAPNGADRFHEMVTKGFYKDIAFFRVMNGFMAQFGIYGDPKIAQKWQGARIPDDPVKQSNARGTITFATAGPNTRTTQLFINYRDNTSLDGMGFSPFGTVVKGMENVDQIFKVGDGPPKGAGPSQGRVQTEGNTYLKKFFPKLDYIKSAKIVE